MASSVAVFFFRSLPPSPLASKNRPSFVLLPSRSIGALRRSLHLPSLERLKLGSSSFALSTVSTDRPLLSTASTPKSRPSLLAFAGEAQARLLLLPSSSALSTASTDRPPLSTASTDRPAKPPNPFRRRCFLCLL